MKKEDNLKSLVNNAVALRKERVMRLTKEFDVSRDLSEDAAAKLQLLHGDCIVIPRHKLKEYIEKIGQ